MEKLDYLDIHSVFVLQVLECYANCSVTPKELPLYHHLHSQSHIKYSTSTIFSPNGSLCFV